MAKPKMCLDMSISDKPVGRVVIEVGSEKTVLFYSDNQWPFSASSRRRCCRYDLTSYRRQQVREKEYVVYNGP